MSLINLNCEYIDTAQLTIDTNNYENKLICMHLNIRSLPCKFDELKMLLSEIEQTNAKPDLILLCETWLNTKNDGLYNIDGYSFVNTHRTKQRGGGVAMYIRKNIAYKLRDDVSIFEEGTFESLFIEITLNGVNHIIGEIYRCPGSNERHFLDTYENLLNQIKKENKNVIIGTDQNLDLMKFQQHANTAELLDINFANGLIPTITRPTRITHSTATLIDNLYISNNCHISRLNSKILISDISDHFPIMIGIVREVKKKAENLEFKKENLIMIH